MAANDIIARSLTVTKQLLLPGVAKIESSVVTKEGTLTYEKASGSLFVSTGKQWKLVGGEEMFTPTLSSSGGDVSLVSKEVGPALSIKGISSDDGILVYTDVNGQAIRIRNTRPGIQYTAGAGITINDTNISNTSPGSSVTLSSSGGDVSLVSNDSGPMNLKVKGVIPGEGIHISDEGSYITISHSAPQVSYSAGEGIHISEEGVISAVLPEQTPLQTSGEGISLLVDSSHLKSIRASGLAGIIDGGDSLTIHVEPQPIPSYSSGAGIAISDGVISSTCLTGVLCDNTISISGSPTLPLLRGNYVAGNGIEITGNIIHNTAPRISYSQGPGIIIENGVISNSYALNPLRGGRGIHISYDNVISTTIDLKEFTAGEGIAISEDGVITNTSPSSHITLSSEETTPISHSIISDAESFKLKTIECGKGISITPTESSLIISADHSNSITKVCFFNNTSQFRRGGCQGRPQLNGEIDFMQYTDRDCWFVTGEEPDMIVYSSFDFELGDNNAVTIVEKYPSNESSIGDLDQLSGVVSQNPHSKIIVSISSEKWNELASKTTKIVNFATEISNFIDTNQIHGIHIDWDTPTETPHSELQELTALRNIVMAIRNIRPDVIVSITIPSKEPIIRNVLGGAIDEDMSSYLKDALSYVFMKTYDIHGPWENSIQPSSGIEYQSFVSIFKSTGIHPSKLIMGIPFFGRAWETFLPVTSPLPSSPFGVSAKESAGMLGSDEIGLLTYADVVCLTALRHTASVQTSARTIYDANTCSAYTWFKVSSSILNVNVEHPSSQWHVVSYDTPSIIQDKVRYARISGIGGVFASDISADLFFRGRPLWSAIVKNA